MPSTGTIQFLGSPGGPGVREDRGIEQSSEVSLYYDSLLSKLLVWAPTRPEAIGKMVRALEEYVILGVKTNAGFCAEILNSDNFRSGRYSTRLLDRDLRIEELQGWRVADLTLVAALVSSLEEDRVNSFITNSPTLISSWKMNRPESTSRDRGWRSGNR
jgi:acetyl-CoA carboxylase biotin carboxylase subunit